MCAPSPSHDSTTASRPTIGLVGRVVAVAHVVAEQRGDLLAVIRLPRLDVGVEPSVDVRRSISSPPPFRSPKLAAQQLARGRPRQLGDELEPLRDLVAGQEPPRNGRRSPSASSATPSRSTTTATTASCHSGSARPTPPRRRRRGGAAAPPRPRRAGRSRPRRRSCRRAGPRRTGSPRRRSFRRRRCAASRPRRRTPAPRQGPGPGSRRPGSAGGS